MAFLNEAGVVAEPAPGGKIRIGSQTFRRSSLPKTPRDRARWIDRRVMELAPSRLLEAIGSELDRDGLTAVPRPHGYAILEQGQPLVLICATHAHAFRRKSILGNFLCPGQHWDGLRQQLAGIEQRRERRRASAEERRRRRLARGASAGEAQTRRRVLHQFPAEVDDAFARAAKESSARIRSERTLAFDHPVVIDAPVGEIRFEPITERPAGAEVPFTYGEDREVLRAALRLLSRTDPLALVILEGNDEALIWRGWPLALCA